MGDSRYNGNARNVAANAIAAQLDGGFIKLYTGARPADPSVAISNQTLLATLTLSNPAFANAVTGVATANAIGSGTAAATGTAVWARLYKADGTTAVIDVDVGTVGTCIVLGSVAIVTGAVVSISSFTYTQPATGT